MKSLEYIISDIKYHKFFTNLKKIVFFLIEQSLKLMNVEQFKALSMKNWILFRRSIKTELIILLIPIFSSFFAVLIRDLAPVSIYEESQLLANSTFSPQFIINKNSSQLLKNCSPDEVVALVPKGNQLINNLSTQLLTLNKNYKIQQFQTDQEVDSIIRSSNYGINYPYFCFGISLQLNQDNIKYSLRFNVSDDFSKTEAPSSNLGTTSKWKQNLDLYMSSLNSRFISTSFFMNNFILQMETNSSYFLHQKISPIYQQQLTVDQIYSFLKISGDFIFLLPLITIFLKQTSSMLVEKEYKIREAMSITGMSTRVYYLTWFLRYFIEYFLLNIIISGVIIGIFKYVPYYIPFTIFLLFHILLIIQSFFIQIFVTRAKIGIIISMGFFVFQYVINFMIANNQNLTESIYMGVSAVPHVAFLRAFQTMFYAESIKVPVTFTESVNNYTILIAIVSFLVNIVFWGLLTLYLDQVFPNQWGAKKHPLFCFGYKEKIIESSAHSNPIKNQSAQNLQNELTQSIEQEVERKYKDMKDQKLVVIRNLTKSFDHKKAVNGLSLTLYSDQISVLLGHNGAGKSVTISILTGMIKPTSGFISMLGSSKIENIRKKIGFCPQHDSLYENLTVLQHLCLYAGLRGVKGSQFQNQVSKLLYDVRLEKKKNELTKNLSGGQQRRLSVALAFAGGAKVIILDEPTAGLDLCSRRHIWEILKNYKNDRIILLTTQYMDEADYLGDRIGIIAQGKLQAIGSNIFLKNKYGSGYNLTFIKRNTHIFTKPFVDCVKNIIKDSALISDLSLEICFRLPNHQIENFPKLFSKIDNLKEELGYETYGVSITTLEEVFLKINQKEDQVRASSKINQNYQAPSMGKIQRQDQPRRKFFSHFLSTLKKRLRVIRRDLKSFIFEIALPLLFILLGLMLMKISFTSDLPSQQYSYREYLNQLETQYLPISSHSINQNLLYEFQEKLVSLYGTNLKIERNFYQDALKFDKNFLLSKKLEMDTLKGGIYLDSPVQINSTTILSFVSIANTRSPTSILSVQTLAAQVLINLFSPKKITITAVSKPFAKTYKELKSSGVSGFFGAILFSIGLALKFGSTASFIVRQRQEKCKYQQIVCGMNVHAYWVGNFVYDFILYLIVAVFCLVLCVALSIQPFYQGKGLQAACLIFLFYGLSNISFNYLICSPFQDYGGAQVKLFIWNCIIGGGFPIFILILRQISESSNQIARGIAWLLRIFPSYCFGEGLMNICSIFFYSQIQKNNQLQQFSSEIALAPIIYLACTACVFPFLIYLMEVIQRKQHLSKMFSKKQSPFTQIHQILDQNTRLEQKIAQNGKPQDFQILAKKIRKVFCLNGKNKFITSVKNLSLAVKKGQIFGLLGVNGAGKSTTFKMLSGQLSCTSGESFLSGLNVSQNLDQIRKNLGYCPQFDALIDCLTVEQQLSLYYDMKCLPKTKKQSIISQKIKELDLQQYKNKQSGQLSGGNKRKLSVAIATIGNPPIVFLDEPSKGMDTMAKRFMWKVLSRMCVQKKQSTVILSTHEMEEAQALSTRIGIMIKGNFRCIGTPQQVKSKYGNGFEVQIRIRNVAKFQIEELQSKSSISKSLTIKKEDLQTFLKDVGANQKCGKSISQEGVGNYIWNKFQSTETCPAYLISEYVILFNRVEEIKRMFQKLGVKVQLIEQFLTHTCFRLDSKVKIGQIFKLLEQKKLEMCIVNYSIKFATLEQIFNSFAKEDEQLER